MFKRKKKAQQQEDVLKEVETTEQETMIDEDFVASMEKDINHKDEISFEEFDQSIEYNDDVPNAELNMNSFFEDQLEQEEELEVLEDEKPTSENKDINQFFEKDDKSLKEIKKTPKKKKEKKQSKRSKKKERDLEDIKERKIFKYQNKKYNSVSDFVNFLLDHYLEMDDIAKEVLDDENFYGWLSKNSAQFEESIKKFKEIKEKIEK